VLALGQSEVGFSLSFEDRLVVGLSFESLVRKSFACVYLAVSPRFIRARGTREARDEEGEGLKRHGITTIYGRAKRL
jgi:hypothetical protein